MKIEQAAIDIFVGSDSPTIKLYDKKSSTVFAEITLNPEQLSQALSRVSYTPCDIEVFGLDRLNKSHHVAQHTFEITTEEKESHSINPKTGFYDGSVLHKRALETCPEGWEPDNYFGRQDTFSQKDGKIYCKVTIRKWD